MIFFDCLGLDGEEDDFDNSGDDCPFTSKVEKDWEDITEEAEEQGWYADGNIDLVRRRVSWNKNPINYSFPFPNFLKILRQLNSKSKKTFFSLNRNMRLYTHKIYIPFPLLERKIPPTLTNKSAAKQREHGNSKMSAK